MKTCSFHSSLQLRFFGGSLFLGPAFLSRWQSEIIDTGGPWSFCFRRHYTKRTYIFLEFINNHTISNTYFFFILLSCCTWWQWEALSQFLGRILGKVKHFSSSALRTFAWTKRSVNQCFQLYDNICFSFHFESLRTKIGKITQKHLGQSS